MKRLLLTLMALFLSLNVLPSSIRTIEAEEMLEIEEVIEVSPYLADAFDSETLKNSYAFDLDGIEYDDVTYLESFDEAVAAFRENAVNRVENFIIYYAAKEPTKLADVFRAALAESESGVGGDYLRWNIGVFRGSNIGSKKVSDTYYYTFTYTMTYYTSLAQEEELNIEIGKLLDSFGFGRNTSEKEKIETIYSYICDNITYDYDHLESSKTGDYYYLMHTAYAALIDKTCVCQGYASLLYRLLKEAGIKCRVMAGKAGEEGHAWNIVKYGDNYYLCDSTWDAGKDEYSWYMLGSDNFYRDGRHIPDNKTELTYQIDYTSEEFLNDHPIDDKDMPYVISYLANGEVVHREYVHEDEKAIGYEHEIPFYGFNCWLNNGELFDFESDIDADLELEGNYSLKLEDHYNTIGDFLLSIGAGRLMSGEIAIDPKGSGDYEVVLAGVRDSQGNELEYSLAPEGYLFNGENGQYSLVFDVNDEENAFSFEIRLLVNGYNITLERLGMYVSDMIGNLVYTGKPVTFNPQVYDDGNRLVLGKDYTLSFKDNKKPGLAALTIKGKGNYSGTITKNFAIVDLSDVDAITLGKKFAVELEYDTAIFDGNKHNPSVKVLDENGNELIKDLDYIVTYGENTNKGKGTINVVGINGYKGIITKNIKITAADISEASIGISSILEYHKAYGGLDPMVELESVRLVPGVDYKFSIKGSLLTIKGIGNYTGSKAFAISYSNANIASLSLELNDVVYKPKANNWRSTAIINDNGKKLSSKTDFETPIYTYGEDVKVMNYEDPKNPISIARSKGELVSVKDQVPDGTTINVAVVGKGNYEGLISGSYRVMSKTISKVKVSVESQIFTGKEIVPSKSMIAVYDGEVKLSDDQYEIIALSKNIKAGKASMTIHGVGDYSGKKTIKFTIAKKAIVEDGEADYQLCDVVDMTGNEFLLANKVINGVIYKKVEVYSDDVAKNIVISQDIVSGQVMAGSVIMVYVSKGAEPRGHLLVIDEYQSICGKGSVEETQNALLAILKDFNNISFQYESSQMAVGSIIAIYVDGEMSYEPGSYKLSVPIVIVLCDRKLNQEKG